MAIDNLNYYSAGLPAGQQTDKYSSQPGCLKSKNLDIFSSSKSVKGTAWTTPTSTNETGVLLTDQTGNLVLKSDGNVYDRSSGSEVLVKSDIAANFPVYKVSYNGKYGTYADAQWGTEKQLISKYENGNLKAFDIFTDRSRYSYTAERYVVSMTENMVGSSDKWTPRSETVTWDKNDNTENTSIKYKLSGIQGFTDIDLCFIAHNSHSAAEGTLSLRFINIERNYYYYDAELDQMVARYDTTGPTSIPITQQLEDQVEIRYKIPLAPLPEDAAGYGIDYNINIGLKVTPGTDGTYTRASGFIMIYADGGYFDYYSYLPKNENRYLEDIGEYYWDKGLTFQPLYKWNGEWVDHIGTWERTVRYRLDKYIGWESDVSMDVVSMIVWNEQVYMIGNMNGNGYIIPCDLSGGVGTPYIAYGCSFKGATNIDYLLYLVGDDRGVSQLWVYNGQELVPLLGGNEEEDSKNLIKNDEQYKFDGKIVEYRGNLVLSTTDNRIFEYGQTYGGKGGAFIHEIPADQTIDYIRAKDNQLMIGYFKNGPREVDQREPDLYPPPDHDLFIQIYDETGASILWSGPFSYNPTASELITNYGGTYGFEHISLGIDGKMLSTDYLITQDLGVLVQDGGYEPMYYIKLYKVGDTWDKRYITIYQDDVPVKNYNTEWMAEYPIVIGNHLLEKEESDLYVSYILPSADCSLEFWGMANHYHFRTFTSADNQTLSTSTDYKLKGATGNYVLKFIERNDNQYTFRLEGDLPVQTTNEMKITTSAGVDVLTYSDYNHFRKIGDITTDKYLEGEFRFHNLNNKLELPKSYSLQIMVKGKGTANYTPELFSVDLVANQRDRG